MVVEQLELAPVATTEQPPLPSLRISQPADVPTQTLALAALVEHLHRQLAQVDAERRKAAADASQLRRQIREAARVQRSRVRHQIELGGATLHSLYRPLDCIGGDVLAVEHLDDAQIALSLGDVSGHGVSAAMLAPVLERALTATDPAGIRLLDHVLPHANHEVAALDRRDGVCASAIHARYDARRRTLRFVRAGHPHPILVRRGQTPRQLHCSGTLLGAERTGDWPVHTIELTPGDCVLFFTDGLAALLGCGHEALLDASCVQRWLSAGAGQTPQWLLDDVRERIDRATWNTAVADDVSVVVLAVDA